MVNVITRHVAGAFTAAAVTLVVVAPGAASAAPVPSSAQGFGVSTVSSSAVCAVYDDFDWWEGRHGATSVCPQGTYNWQHRAVISCGSGIHYGPWVGGTSRSSAWCQIGETDVRGYWVEEGPQES